MTSEVVLRSPWPQAVGGNMHMDTRVIKVADFKYEVK